MGTGGSSRTGPRVAALLAVLWAGCAFGFFHAWAVAMPGLDAADPHAAMAAMRAMNAAVRVPGFAAVFFGVPLIAGAAGLWCLAAGRAWAGALLLAAAGLYGLLVMAPTARFNVPLNEALALAAVPAGTAEAQAIWRAYSAPWQAWNLLRLAGSGGAFALAAAALLALGRGGREP